jgi:hypothetical protein
MPVHKTEYVIAGIRAHVYRRAADAPSQLDSLPIAVVFLLHGRGGCYERMEPISNRLLELQDAQPEQAKRELVVVAFVRGLCQHFTAIFSLNKLPGP